MIYGYCQILELDHIATMLNWERMGACMVTAELCWKPHNSLHKFIYQQHCQHSVTCKWTPTVVNLWNLHACSSKNHNAHTENKQSSTRKRKRPSGTLSTRLAPHSEKTSSCVCLFCVYHHWNTCNEKRFIFLISFNALLHFVSFFSRMGHLLMLFSTTTDVILLLFYTTKDTTNCSTSLYFVQKPKQKNTNTKF